VRGEKRVWWRVAFAMGGGAASRVPSLPEKQGKGGRKEDGGLGRSGGGYESVGGGSRILRELLPQVQLWMLATRSRRGR